MNNEYINNYLQSTNTLIELMIKSENLKENFSQAINRVVQCMKSGNKVLFIGNGGSAADAQHMSAEFVSRFMFDRPGLPSIALTTDTSALTAIGNDYGFEKLFSRQIQALGKAGDVLIAYSTSGASPNILLGLEEANKMGITTIGLTGIKTTNDLMVSMCDIPLVVPSDSTPHIQEGHLILGHMLCGAVEKIVFTN